MLITTAELARLVGAKESPNLKSFHIALQKRGTIAGLHKASRLVACLAQLAHESQDFKYDREIWGPTPAQKRYDTRTDLGNTPEVDGDGELYAGRGPLQVTGASNYKAFRDWARRVISSAAPDFVVWPDLLNTDPWEGLSVLWYWETRSLNFYADSWDMIGLTKRINGGTNGLADRQERWLRISLRFLGFSSVREFQLSRGIAADGIVGQLTRTHLHQALDKAPNVVFSSEAEDTPAPAGLPNWLRWLLSIFTRKV